MFYVGCVITIYRLRRILHHKQVVLLCHRHDCVHVARHTGVMHRNDDFRTRRDKRLQGLRIEVRIALHTIRKDHLCALAQEGQRRRDEGITRHNYFVARLQLAQHGAHLQCVRTGSRQERLTKTIMLFKPRLAALGELAVTGQLTGKDRFVHVMGFLAREMRLIKIYHKKNTITPTIIIPIATILRRVMGSLNIHHAPSGIRR